MITASWRLRCRTWLGGQNALIGRTRCGVTFEGHNGEVKEDAHIQGTLNMRRACTLDLYCVFLSALEQFYADSRLHWAIDLGNTASGWQDKAPISVGRNHLGGIAYKGRLVSFRNFVIRGMASRTIRNDSVPANAFRQLLRMCGGGLIAPEADPIDHAWLALQYCFGGQLGTDEYTLNQDIAEVRSSQRQNFPMPDIRWPVALIMTVAPVV